MSRVGEDAYAALYATYGGESAGRIHDCTIGRTPLSMKEEVSRARAMELHPELVRAADRRDATRHAPGAGESTPP